MIFFLTSKKKPRKPILDVTLKLWSDILFPITEESDSVHHVFLDDPWMQINNLKPIT